MKKPAEENSCNAEGFGYKVFYIVLLTLIIIKVWV
jgi:hypothetical protein